MILDTQEEPAGSLGWSPAGQEFSVDDKKTIDIVGGWTPESRLKRGWRQVEENIEDPKHQSVTTVMSTVVMAFFAAVLTWVAVRQDSDLVWVPCGMKQRAGSGARGGLRQQWRKVIAAAEASGDTISWFYPTGTLFQRWRFGYQDVQCGVTTRHRGARIHLGYAVVRIATRTTSDYLHLAIRINTRRF